MTDDTIAFQKQLEKTSDADLLREMIGFAAERLMALEVQVQALTGAGHGERTPDQRLNGSFRLRMRHAVTAPSATPHQRAVTLSMMRCSGGRSSLAASRRAASMRISNAEWLALSPTSRQPTPMLRPCSGPA